MHSAPTGRLTLPHKRIVNSLERFVGTEDQAGNKPADMLKSFSPTKDLPKAFHPPGNGLRYPSNRQHGFGFFFITLPPYSSEALLSRRGILFRVIKSLFFD
jgi:hypothetical protein